MSENLKKFLEFIGKDSTLIEKAKGLKADDPEKAKEIAIAFAKENGFELTEADFEVSEGELSVDELKTVAGGGDCYCVVGGGGTKTNNKERVCACVLAGGGQGTNNYIRCTCIGAGSGEEI